MYLLVTIGDILNFYVKYYRIMSDKNINLAKMKI